MEADCQQAASPELMAITRLLIAIEMFSNGPSSFGRRKADKRGRTANWKLHAHRRRASQELLSADALYVTRSLE
jgi:hypothetical protein